MGFLLLIAVVLIIGFAFACYIFYLVWQSGKFGRVVLGVMVATFSWLVYDAIYPDESFYISELHRLVKIDLPADAVFFAKDATFPDHFGDYSACFIIQLTPTSMAALRSQLGEPVPHKNTAFECKSRSVNIANAAEILDFDLSPRATREDAMIYISLAPNENLVIVSWFLW